MPDAKQGVVKLLSDDALREIEARANAATEGPWEYTPFAISLPNVVGPLKSLIVELPDHVRPLTEKRAVQCEADYQFMAHAREDIPALCATVRALRATHSCGAVDGGSVVGGCGKEVLTADGFRCADCLAWFHRDCINEHFKLDAYVKKLRELREQGAIDDWKKSLADKEAENTALRKQLADALFWKRQQDGWIADVEEREDGDRQLNTVATSVSIKSIVQCIDATIRFTVPVNLQAKLRGHINELILLLRHRAIQLCRSKAADYQAARDEAYAGVPTCDAVGENEVRKAVASQLAAELERDLLN